MTVSLREFMAQRRADLQAAIKAARAELAELDAAEQALDVAAGAAPKQRRERGSAGSGKKTLKELALEALQENVDGLEATAILAWIKAKYDMDIARESMSPQLSRLGGDGDIVRNGLIWRLAAYEESDPHAPAQNDETPGGATPSASVDDPFRGVVL